MNFVEKLESWRWIKPIPTKPPKKSEKPAFVGQKSSTKKTLSTFASHLREWQKEQKYNYSRPGVNFSAFSNGIAKSARKFKSELDKIRTNLIPARHSVRESDGSASKKSSKVTLLYEDKNKRNPFKRLNDDEDDVIDNDVDVDDAYLVPKTTKFVTFAEPKTSFSSIASNSSTSVDANPWLWSVSSYLDLMKHLFVLLACH